MNNEQSAQHIVTTHEQENEISRLCEQYLAHIGKTGGINRFSLKMILREAMLFASPQSTPGSQLSTPVTDEQLQKEAEEWANNCVDITTTTWQWIVDAFIAGAALTTHPKQHTPNKKVKFTAGKWRGGGSTSF